jgi:hypothetical protein
MTLEIKLEQISDEFLPAATALGHKTHSPLPTSQRNDQLVDLFKWLGLCSEKFELCPSMLFSSADGSLSE